MNPDGTATKLVLIKALTSLSRTFAPVWPQAAFWCCWEVPPKGPASSAAPLFCIFLVSSVSLERVPVIQVGEAEAAARTRRSPRLHLCCNDADGR